MVEYLCRTVHGPTMIGTEVYQSCYTEQLTALREPFGANLSNLTRADRRSLDAWCGPMQSAGDRDAYLACLNRQLVRLEEQRDAKAKQVEPEAQEEVPASDPPRPSKPSPQLHHRRRPEPRRAALAGPGEWRCRERRGHGVCPAPPPKSITKI